MSNLMTLEQMAARFGCSIEQIKAQFIRNGKQLAEMADAAKRTGKKVNKYTEQQLREMSARMYARAAE